MIKIFSDPTCNFTLEECREYQVDILPYTISYQGQEYETLSYYTQYTQEYQLKTLIGDIAPSFARPPLGKWKEMLEPFLKAGDDILYIAMSQKATGAQASLNILSVLFKDQYSRQITIYDTRSFSWGEAYLLKEACKLRDQNLTVPEIIEVLQEKRKNLENWYLPLIPNIWAGVGRGDSSTLKDLNHFTLLTGDSNGVCRPEGAFRSRTEALEALKLKQASEVWISFTPDFSGQEIKDILEYTPKNTRVYSFSGPMTSANFGRKTIELMCLR